MKKYYFLFISFWFLCSTYSQVTKTQWKIDLDCLQNKLLSKDFLFKQFSKKDFKISIQNLKTDIDTFSDFEIYWKINEILSSFKVLNLTTEKEKIAKLPFYVKVFNNKYYLIKINKTNSYLLGYELIKINNISIKEITKKLKTIFYLAHKNVEKIIIEKQINNKSLLSYLDLIEKDSLRLTFRSKTNKIETIYLPINTDLYQSELVKINTKKELFNQRKNNIWFWKYGINFGKQVFLKYKVCSSKEHILKMKDSLNINAIKYAKDFKIPLQNIYDAPKFHPFVYDVIEKFKKRRYKKLIIDLRNNTKGALLNSKKLINSVLKKRRINKKGRLFIIANKNTNAAAIATILAFKKHTKVVIISETVFGTKEDSNNSSFIYLTNSKIRINYPLNLQQEISITPNVLVKPTFNQYKKGVDPFLQKILDY